MGLEPLWLLRRQACHGVEGDWCVRATGNRGWSCTGCADLRLAGLAGVGQAGGSSVLLSARRKPSSEISSWAAMGWRTRRLRLMISDGIRWSRIVARRIVRYVARRTIRMIWNERNLFLSLFPCFQVLHGHQRKEPIP